MSDQQRQIEITREGETGQLPNAERAMNPGDQAPPGAPGAAENICRDCGGTGRLPDGRECPTCGGTGRVIEVVSAGP